MSPISVKFVASLAAGADEARLGTHIAEYFKLLIKEIIRFVLRLVALRLS